MPPPGRAASKTGRGVGVPPASVTTTDADAAADRLTAARQGTATVKGYGYDAAGRTTPVASSAGTTTLAYDFESRVKTISGRGYAAPVRATGARSRDPRGKAVDLSPFRDARGRWPPGTRDRERPGKPRKNEIGESSGENAPETQAPGSREVEK